MMILGFLGLGFMAYAGSRTTQPLAQPDLSAMSRATERPPSDGLPFLPVCTRAKDSGLTAENRRGYRGMAAAPDRTVLAGLGSGHRPTAFDDRRSARRRNETRVLAAATPCKPRPSAESRRLRGRLRSSKLRYHSRERPELSNLDPQIGAEG